ncbi:hypothetical protein JCM21714_2415 [Gracilibacillus boraciitolerans JCM 21714]|uniref:Integral membrane protein n=1 Tax=Gracilibacillus boraciitolerans JCM 21714 TaxID=1298598 RepID=W4VIW1_9BACI|nr:DUF2269 family protein [Gracilibacillus boraciitolerans]GAE93340.1 hypothetical protein JCM21714_2415 [Gracilibacillus boraciitolerans JCM 21714]
MHSLYTWLIIIHIFSAIVGIGPGFILTTIVKSAKTMPEIRQAFAMKRNIHIFVMIGGILVLITGVCMGLLQPMLFQQGWYITSMILYFIALSLGPTFLKKYSSPIKEMIRDEEKVQVPAGYQEHIQKLLRVEYLENTLLLIVIFLMITKPF